MKRTRGRMKTRMKNFAASAVLCAGLMLPGIANSAPKKHKTTLVFGGTYNHFFLYNTDHGRVQASLEFAMPLTSWLKMAMVFGGHVDETGNPGLEQARFALRADYRLFSARAFLLNSKYLSAVLAPGGALCIGPICAGGRYELIRENGLRKGPHVIFVKGTIPMWSAKLVPTILAVNLPDKTWTYAANLAADIPIKGRYGIRAQMFYLAIAKNAKPQKIEATVAATIKF